MESFNRSLKAMLEAAWQAHYRGRYLCFCTTKASKFGIYHTWDSGCYACFAVRMKSQETGMLHFNQVFLLISPSPGFGAALTRSTMMCAWGASCRCSVDWIRYENKIEHPTVHPPWPRHVCSGTQSCGVYV